MTENTLLQVTHVDAFHGSFQALWDVSLTVQPGEIIAIIGANGAGKSTLLDTVSGLVHPVRGSVTFGGEDISALEPYDVVRRGIAQTPEGRHIFPDLTVMENLVIGSYNRRARSSREDNLARVYDFFPVLKERKSQLARTLSGGEQQMMVIGRCLMSNPRLMLLDEMSLGLAPIVVNELYKVLKKIREGGITIVFVEQNVRRSLSEADRAYIMEAGRIILEGSAAELKEEEKVKKAYFGV